MESSVRIWRYAALSTILLAITEAAPKGINSPIESYQNQRLPHIPGYIPVYIKHEEGTSSLKSNSVRPKYKIRPQSIKTTHQSKRGEIDNYLKPEHQIGHSVTPEHIQAHQKTNEHKLIKNSQHRQITGGHRKSTKPGHEHNVNANKNHEHGHNRDHGHDRHTADHHHKHFYNKEPKRFMHKSHLTETNEKPKDKHSE